MAEALSLAASGIAVAQLVKQVGKSIIKLKQLWDELQDVPSTIANLLDQIDCLDPALWAAENSFSQASLPPIIWDDRIASRSTAYCRKALDSLNEIVDELTAQIHRPGKLGRKLRRINVVLKKEQLKCLESRLQSAVRMLMLAQQSYLVALTRVQPEIIIQRFTEVTMPLVAKARQDDLQLDRARGFYSHRHRLPSQPAHPDNDGGPDHRDLVPYQSMRRQDIVILVRFRLPTWLCRRAWELQSSRSYGNWRINLLSYRTIPDDSEVFRIAKFGKPEELRALFDSGVASPYDRSVGSQTLLHAAVLAANKPVAEYLLGTGLSATEVNEHQLAPIDMASIIIMIVDYRGPGSQLPEDWSAMKGFEKFYDVRLADTDDSECSCWNSLHSRGYYTSFRRFECPWHENTTLESRLRALGTKHDVSKDPTMIPDILQPYWSEGISKWNSWSKEYGRRENELLADKDIGIENSRIFAQWDATMGRFRIIPVWLRGYVYGPEPEDWRILWSFPERGYAADFWRLVEDGAQLVPGAWVEDDDDGFDDIWF
ncbi:putative ankyrin repeat-containing protein [Rosellinia necatrix]|uniref:Putative ankyrin repeat-containing protein n=1 Tax=Rosellinia necatrix TaxID=77044 RepID=A0A1S8A9A7_ROSNE|nr:putative ankyrin repeat-containing protein [Rosellinia necatrix]